MTLRDPETEAAIEDAVAEWLERRERDEDPIDLAAFLSSRPDADEVRRRIDRLGRLGLLEADESAAESVQLGDFVCGERIGGGGMGIVYRGRQRSVDREVAIKVLHAGLALSPVARDRFERETALLARLEHPGIVRVIGAGEVDERPFLAMELVRGVSLQDVVRSVRDRVSSQLTGGDLGAVIEQLTGTELDEGGRELCRGTWIDAVLRVLQQATSALAYAHGQGVLHRDVKPSNVMVTAAGRVSVLDFGLSVSLDPDSVRVTRTGSTPGSPAYMAPEQARGGALDPRTDVYGLGVTMYELLALELPFLADSEPELQQRIAHGEVVPLPHRNRAVSKDVATVCAMAMDRDPARRYVDARAFADDLGRLLRRESVAARPPGPWLRLRRWARRRPAAATALCSAVLLLGGVPTLLWLQQQAAAERLTREWQRAERGEARARANLGTALQVVDRFLRGFGCEELAEEPLMSAAARAAVRDAVAFYEELREREPGAAQLGVDHVRALGNLAWLLGVDGGFERSITVMHEALALAAAEPDDLGMAFERVHLLRLESKALAALGRREEAARKLDEAQAVAVFLRGESGPEAEVDLLFAGLDLDRARQAEGRGQGRDAVRASTQAIALLERHARSGNPLVAVRLAAALGYRGFVTKALGDVGGAMTDAQRAVALLDDLPEQEAVRPHVRLILANALGLRGQSFWSGDVEGGLASQERAVALLTKLNEDFPDSREVRLSHCRQLRLLAEMLVEVGRQSEAGERLAVALALLREVTAGSAGSSDDRMVLVEALSEQAAQCRRADDDEGAERALREAAALAKGCGEGGGLPLGQQLARVDAVFHHARILYGQGHHDAAIADLEWARALAAQLRAKAPDDVAVARWLGLLLVELVDRSGAGLAPEAGQAMLQSARELYLSCLDREPDDPWTLDAMSVVEVDLALREWEGGEREASVVRLEQAMAAARRACGARSRQSYREHWVDACTEWMKRAATLGRWEEVAAVASAPPPAVADAYPVGSAFVQAAALAWVEVAGPPAAKEQFRAPLRAAALASLDRARAAGHTDSGWRQLVVFARLAGDPEFGPLLERLDRD